MNSEVEKRLDEWFDAVAACRIGLPGSTGTKESLHSIDAAEGAAQRARDAAEALFDQIRFTRKMKDLNDETLADSDATNQGRRLYCVGITEAEVDKVVPPRRPFKMGDIVRCVKDYYQLTVDRLYHVEKDESPFTSTGDPSPDGKSLVKVMKDDRKSGRYPPDAFDLVQMVDE